MEHNNKKLDTFIKKSIKRHGNKYDYSKVVYINSTTKVIITCPEHGDFEQTPAAHVRGNGCPYCANKRRGCEKYTTDVFVEKLKNVHGNRYDYSKVEYKSANDKIDIICHRHNKPYTFKQLPFGHLSGQGCPICSGKLMNTDIFIEKSKDVHGDKYDYSNTIYETSNKLVKITCKVHGEFEQKPYKHLIGHGCPKCGIEQRVEKQYLNKEEFIQKSINIHGNKYDYSKVIYNGMREKVCIICPKHGEFWQYPFDHINEHGCPSCGVIMSNNEREIYEYVNKLIIGNNIIRNDRKILNGKEIDIYIPDLNIGIEYNGLRWHSEEFGKDRNYHINKLSGANRKGIKLIQIFEDEYINKKEIVLNKLKHLLCVENSLKRIPGRKCFVNEIDKNSSKAFLDKYHIQGYGKSSISLGCFYNGKLIAVMSFLNKNNGEWELVRFASDYHYICQGVGGKLFKHFIKKYDPIEIKTFADRRWTIDIENNLYTKLGFINDGCTNPDYRYVNPYSSKYERIHKFNFRKRSIHKKYNLPMKMTEKEMCSTLGFYKIWDCGLIRYKWKKVEH